MAYLVTDVCLELKCTIHHSITVLLITGEYIQVSTLFITTVYQLRNILLTQMSRAPIIYFDRIISFLRTIFFWIKKTLVDIYHQQVCNYPFALSSCCNITYLTLVCLFGDYRYVDSQVNRVSHQQSE
jgi:hypothetical protein